MAGLSGKACYLTVYKLDLCQKTIRLREEMNLEPENDIIKHSKLRIEEISGRKKQYDIRVHCQAAAQL